MQIFGDVGLGPQVAQMNGAVDIVFAAMGPLPDHTPVRRYRPVGNGVRSRPRHTQLRGDGSCRTASPSTGMCIGRT